MARRKGKIELNLFPFLSVLSALIAVNLLLMIVTISTRVFPKDEGASPTPSKEGGGQADDPSEGAVPDGIDQKSYNELDGEIRKLEKSLVTRRQERDDLRLELKDLASKIKLKDDELDRAKVASAPKTGRSIGVPPRVKIIPRLDAKGIQRNPVFIEVSSGEYVLHPVKAEKRVFPIEASGAIPAGLQTLLKEIADDSKNRYPLLLVKPNGAEAWEKLVDYIGDNHRAMSIGWEPFSSQWLLETAAK